MLSSVLPSSFLSRLIIVFSATVLVTGCTTLDISDSDVDVASATGVGKSWQERQSELAAIKYWRLTGRLAVSNGDDAWNLNIEWHQREDDYQIVLNGPFGAGKVKLVGNANGVLLKDSDDQTFYAETPEMLLYEQTGLYMPVNGLRYWVMGLTSPNQHAEPQLDNLGRIAYLEEADWKVRFKRYTQVSGIDLPRKVFIVRSNKELDVRLVVDNWKLGAF
jgi:outer membrane lipoprotein LolB